MRSPLTVERLRAALDYEPESGEFRWRIKSVSHVSVGGRAGATSKNGYRIIGLDGVRYNAHRLAWLYTNGTWPNGDIDHRNGVKADNRISNLREATRSQNNANRKETPSRTGFRGVYFDPKTERYQAKIRKRHLGYFATPEEGSEAYRKAAHETYGEFARPTKNLRPDTEPSS